MHECELLNKQAVKQEMSLSRIEHSDQSENGLINDSFSTGLKTLEQKEDRKGEMMDVNTLDQVAAHEGGS